MPIDQILKSICSLGPFPTNDIDKLRSLVEKELKMELAELINNDNYNIIGRIGRFENWAFVPWIGIHNKQINSNATTGVYLCLLFNTLGDGIAVTIQHGSDGYRRQELVEKVSNIKRNIGNPSDISFNKEELNRLFTEKEWIAKDGTSRQVNTGDRPYNYKLANIVGKEIELDFLPKNIGDDIVHLFEFYDSWCKSKIINVNNHENDYQQYYPHQNRYITDREQYWNAWECEPDDRIKTTELSTGYLYPKKDTKTGVISLIKSGYKCNIDPSHQTFMWDGDEKYMEKHHLIPMEHYTKFEKNIDHHSNIFSLCPNCRKKLQLSPQKTKSTMLKTLFEKRKEQFRTYWSITDSRDLLKYYR